MSASLSEGWGFMVDVEPALRLLCRRFAVVSLLPSLDGT
ncbi:hypothetical protein A176_003431 [Myxococcus hansupus]|uniref:Uncharacterized protein n=1 Tax=Pseudomyxococcus hansupus TaxID=1297742 RepID=A0A0H4WUQ6_9BACT|nr:hypothetical protein A176_003431 [Myxococcus hansupus]